MTLYSPLSYYILMLLLGTWCNFYFQWVVKISHWAPHKDVWWIIVCSTHRRRERFLKTMVNGLSASCSIWACPHVTSYLTCYLSGKTVKRNVRFTQCVWSGDFAPFYLTVLPDRWNVRFTQCVWSGDFAPSYLTGKTSH